MMGIGWLATANKTGLPDDVPHMIAVTDATRFREGKHALIDLGCYPGAFDRHLKRSGSRFWLVICASASMR
jgi:hypothetical protein